MNSGFGYPNQAVTVNLAPAHVRKEGAGFDLPMALAILGAMGTFRGSIKHLSVGELSLDGRIRPVRGRSFGGGVRAATSHREPDPAAGKRGGGSVVEGVNVFGVRHLAEVVAMLSQPDKFRAGDARATRCGPDLSDRAGLSRCARPDHQPSAVAGGGGGGHNVS